MDMLSQQFSKGLVACLLLSSAVVLSGCGANASFPNAEAVTAPTLRTMPAIQGSNYGGHAPIVGAHIFLLQAGTSGYGAKVTSLLGATSSSGYATALDSTTGSPTNGMYYVTSDSTGQYNLTGDYTCTAGLPVYVYGSGGNPSTNPNSGYSVTITGASAAPDANGNLLVTFTTTGNQLLYQGETVSFGAQNPSNTPYYQFQGTTGVVSSLNLTTTTFAIEEGPSSSTVGYSSFSETATQVQPVVNNPAIANMAVLGICPGQFTVAAVPNSAGTTTLSGISQSDFAKLAVGDTINGPGIRTGGTTISALTAGSGTTTNSITLASTLTNGNASGPYGTYTVNTGTNVFNFGSNSSNPVSYVYMNEVSTVAAAFALAPFASVTSSNNDALHIGTSSTNLAGLQNAALTANNLYDITGHNASTVADGDAHIARSVTPTNLTGSSVPQSLIDTIGNILANCVDSANSYGATATGATESAQCSALFNAATSDGTSSGTKPYDTATAAINIAHHPAGNGTTTTACGTPAVSTFACTLYNALTGNVPFQPYLGNAPNDFTVGITYSGSGLTGANGIAIDASGDAWVPTGSGAVVELSPAGAVLSGSNGYSAGTGSNSSIAIDITGNVWFINGFASVLKMNSIGTLLSGAGGYSTGTYGPSGCTTASPQPHGLAIDANNNVWVSNYSGDDRGQGIALLTNSGTLLGAVNTNNNQCNEATTGNTVVRNNWGIAMDGNGVMYSTGYSSENIAAVNTSTINGSFTIYNNSGSTSVPDGPAYPAIDQNGKVWMPNYYGLVNSTNTAGAGTSISVFTPGTTSASSNATTTVPYTSYSGGGLNGPQAIAVDGGNNIWVAGIGNKYVSELSNAGTAMSPSTGYTGGFTNTVGRLAIDGSGNVWVNSPSGNNVVQMVGAATPTLTPLVTAAKNGTPAAKP
jgi:hypothetical protein